MAKDKFTRTPYEGKDFSRLTSAAPAWAFGCESCQFGRPHGDPYGFCTCLAGQARRRWATGTMRAVDEFDNISIPTANGVAYR